MGICNSHCGGVAGYANKNTCKRSHEYPHVEFFHSAMLAYIGNQLNASLMEDLLRSLVTFLLLGYCFVLECRALDSLSEFVCSVTSIRRHAGVHYILLYYYRSLHYNCCFSSKAFSSNAVHKYLSMGGN